MGTSMSEIGRTRAGGYVYAIDLGGEMVKVGYTANPRARLSSIESIARIFGHPCRSSWVSPLHLDPSANETRLIDAVTAAGGVASGREYFAGIAYADVVRLAQALDFPPFSMSEEMAKQADAGEKLIDLVVRRPEHRARAAADHSATPTISDLVRPAMSVASAGDALEVLASCLNRLEAVGAEVDFTPDGIHTEWASVVPSSQSDLYDALYVDREAAAAAFATRSARR